MSFNEVLKWTLGFRHSNGKYLTAETFGNQINANGAHMRKKQIFTLEQPEGAAFVYLKAPTGRYLSAGQKGEFSADAESAGKTEEWTIIPNDDGSWALKSSFDYYLGGAGDSLKAFSREIGAEDKWIPHLAMHPQVCMFNPQRKAYVHLEEEKLHTNELIPWGVDSMITMEFHDGRYALRASNNKFLSKSGDLIDDINDSSKFIVEFHDQMIALRDGDGNYLAAGGDRVGTFASKRNQVGKNELFLLEDSHPQVKLTAFNDKLVSMKQGDDPKAIFNKSEDLTDLETFQMEIKGTKWAFRTNKGLYWAIKDGVVTTQTGRDDQCDFELSWHGAKLAAKAANGKYITVKGNGAMNASADDAEEAAQFAFDFVNRPQIQLRCEYGFVANRTAALNCNVPVGEVFAMESNNGDYTFKNKDGKYWNTNDDGTISLGDAAEVFHLEMLVHTKFAIKSKNGKYIKGEHQGNFTATSDSNSGNDLLWEY